MNGTRHLVVAAEKVAAVLLADGWHRVAAGSFMVGPFGFSGGDDRGVLGYRFEEISDASLYASATLTGPLEAVLAVRQVASRRPVQEQDPMSRAWSPNGGARVPRHPAGAAELASGGGRLVRCGPA